ncbi:MAG: hypothetical protein JRJ82_20855 [Deltaproteobacteria bacterium]|nr:hypothetical protein [Deltaproteobacteria bacterium]
MPQAKKKVITPALKVPPHNNEAEQAILAGILINNEATNQVMDVLRAEDFYREAHTQLFEGMIALYNDNEPIDLITLSQYLTKTGQLESAGGTGYLAYTFPCGNRTGSLHKKKADHPMLCHF